MDLEQNKRSCWTTTDNCICTPLQKYQETTCWATKCRILSIRCTLCSKINKRNISVWKFCAVSEIKIFVLKYRYVIHYFSLDVDFSYCWLNLEVKLYSLEQYIGLIEDKLSSTTVDFFRSEGYLETKCLYWIREPKKC